jgi:hypothetical protein
MSLAKRPNQVFPSSARFGLWDLRVPLYMPDGHIRGIDALEVLPADKLGPFDDGSCD